MSILEELLTANQEFIEHLPTSYYSQNVHNGKLPTRQIALVTCMDTRLVDFLEPALGIKAGEAKVIKNAGNSVSGTFGTTIRSLMISIFELGVKEVFVIGHYDCGMSKTNSKDLMQTMIQRGISEAAIKMIQKDLEEWIDGFHHPLQNIEQTVAKIQSNPLIPNDIPVHGLIFCPETGKLEVVIDGYEKLKKTK